MTEVEETPVIAPGFLKVTKQPRSYDKPNERQ